MTSEVGLLGEANSELCSNPEEGEGISDWRGCGVAEGEVASFPVSSIFIEDECR